MISTNERVELRSKYGDYVNRESEFPPSELNFIRRVKDNIINNGLYKEIPNRFRTEKSRAKIKYYHINPKYKVGDLLDGCMEIDLNSAYWETAWKMGILSRSLYKQGKTVSKKSRLAAIGSLARVQKVTAFDGIKQKDKPPIKSKLTEFLWHTICDTIGQLMLDAAQKCGEDFIFVWVDAMFIKKAAVPKLERIFKKAGYSFTVEKVKWIRFDPTKIIVKGKGKWGEIDGKKVWRDERPFPYSVRSGMHADQARRLLNK